MKTRRFSPAVLLTLAATAGAAPMPTKPHSPAVARSLAQGQHIDAALRHGRLSLSQANALQDARAVQEHEARQLAAGQQDADSTLALHQQQDLLDWAIVSGNTHALPVLP